MTEGVEAATLNPQLLEQGIELAFPHNVCVPGCSVLGGEQQTKPIRPPGAKESAQVLDQLRRNFAESIAAR